MVTTSSRDKRCPDSASQVWRRVQSLPNNGLCYNAEDDALFFCGDNGFPWVVCSILQKEIVIEKTEDYEVSAEIVEVQAYISISISK